MDSYLTNTSSAPRSNVKRVKIKSPKEPKVKRPRIHVNSTQPSTVVDKNTKKLFVTVFDNKHSVNEMCAMLFGNVDETNTVLKDFLKARAALTLSERNSDFFFKRTSPYSSQDVIDKFKLCISAPPCTVRIIFDADSPGLTKRVPVRRKIVVNNTTRPGTSDMDVELHPHMPDSYNIYNSTLKNQIGIYVKTLTMAIVDFFRRNYESTIIVICIRDIYWLYEELIDPSCDFSQSMFKHYNACIMSERKN